MMWLNDDLIAIENLIRNNHNLQLKKNTPVDIIRGAWLRCDIVTYIWSLIKLGW